MVLGGAFRAAKLLGDDNVVVERYAEVGMQVAVGGLVGAGEGVGVVVGGVGAPASDVGSS